MTLRFPGMKNGARTLSEKGSLMMAKLQSISEGLTILNHSDNIVIDV